MLTVIPGSYLKRFTFTLCILAVSAIGFTTLASATEPRKESIDWNKPIAVATIASVDRVLEDIDYLFSTIEKPEYPAMIKGFLAQYRDLAGLDKSKPLGVFVFLNKGISPQPTVVGFVPIKNLEELTETLGEVGIVLAPVEGEEDRYTLALPNFSLHLKMAHGYAFVQLKSEALDREFYNPDNYTKALASKYDVAGSLLLQNVPEPMRMMAVDLVNAKVDEQLARKPGEELFQYRTRVETTKFLINQFELVATDGESLTFGYDLSKADKQIHLHLGVKAKAGSKLEDELKNASKATSQYSYLNGNAVDFLAYNMFPLRKDFEQKAILDLIEKSKANIPPVLLGDETNPGSVTKMMEASKATIRSGKLDGHVQVLQTSNGKPAVIGALKLTNGETFKEGLQELFDLMLQAEDTEGMEANVAEVEGVTIHKIVPKNMKQDAKEFFGENPVVYVGCGPQACWMAMGEADSLELLKKSISNGQSTRNKPGSAFLMSIKMGQVLPLAEKNAKNRDMLEAAKVAFASGGDLLTLYPKITGNQASLNVDLGEGFVRMISLAIANRK